MKLRLLDIVRCPACRGQLELTIFTEAHEPVSREVTTPACRVWCEADRQALAGAPNNCRSSFDCLACYGREIQEGLLACPQCRLLYPIIEGIPRLVRTAYSDYPVFFFAYREAVARIPGHEEAAAALGRMSAAVFDRRSNESFSLQWRNFEYGDQTWFKDDSELRKAEFLQSLNVSERELDGALVLDAGCGNGKLTASIAQYGAEVVGMDLSESVVRARANRPNVAGDRAPFVHFIQGNVMEPPLAPQVFDYIHSSGVLHHTPNTEAAFRSFLSTARRGAKVYVQLYRKREAWVGIPNILIRAVTSRLPPRLLFALCRAAVPVHTLLVLLIARLRGEHSPIAQASRRERTLSLFDNYSPRYQYRYTPDQVRSMFESAGLLDIRDVTLANEARHMVAFVGRNDGVEPAIARAPARAEPIPRLMPNGMMGATPK